MNLVSILYVYSRIQCQRARPTVDTNFKATYYNLDTLLLVNPFYGSPVVLVLG
jgi:hypothetical protein